MRVRYKQASEHTGLPEGTLRAKVCRKQIPHYRVGPRCVLFDLAELDEWMDSMRVETRDDDAMAKRRAELAAMVDAAVKTDEA